MQNMSNLASAYQTILTGLEAKDFAASIATAAGVRRADPEPQPLVPKGKAGFFWLLAATAVISLLAQAAAEPSNNSGEGHAGN
jgi:hypothetical protein